MSPATPEHERSEDDASVARDDSQPPSAADPAGADAADSATSTPTAADPSEVSKGPGSPVNGSPGGYGQPVPARPRARLRTLAPGVAATLVLILLGAPLGLIWAAVAPSAQVVLVEGGAAPAQPQPEEFVAADGWFSLLGLVFGLLAAIAVWLILRRYRGPVGLLVAALGSIGAAVLAWQVGRQIGLGEYQRLLDTAAVGTTFTKPPDLRAGRFQWLFGVIPVLRGDLLVPAFGAVVTYTMLAGWSRFPRLGAEPEPEPVAVSWGTAEPPAPPAAPAPPAPDATESPRD